MEKYIALEMTIIEFGAEDIIVTSGGGDLPSGGENELPIGG